MRIIKGDFQTFKFKPFKGKNTRPTTDLAKEGIFATLETLIDFTDLECIDIFAGTGHIGLEFLSRGAMSLKSIDLDPENIGYLKSIKKELDIKNWDIVRSDAMKFIDKTDLNVGLIFADPPYDYPNIHDFLSKVLEMPCMENGCIFILEHVDRLVFSQKELFLKKQYGSTVFSCFRKLPD